MSTTLIYPAPSAGTANTLPPDVRGLLQQRARTFNRAAMFLPAAQRDHVTVLYAFCRTVDDLADAPPAGASLADCQRALDEWRAWLGGRPGQAPAPAPLAQALSSTLAATGVPTEHMHWLLDGVQADLDGVRYQTWDGLRRYCMQVAGSVGMAMCHLLGTHGSEAQAAAASLGIAMQLTNILRDVGEDLQDGRCYLPGEDLDRFGVTVENLHLLQAAGGEPSPSVRRLLAFQIDRARHYYSVGATGIDLLQSEHRLAIRIATDLYSAILDEIERGGYRVLRRRTVVPAATKAWRILRCVASERVRGNGQRRSSQAYGLSEVRSWVE